MDHHKGVQSYPINDEMVLLSESTGRLYHANATAVLVWQGFGAGLEIQEIESLLVEAYKVPRDKIASDLDRLIKDWKSIGLLNSGLPAVTVDVSDAEPDVAFSKPKPPVSANPVDTYYQMLDCTIKLRLPANQEASLVQPIFAHLHTLESTDWNLKLEVRKAVDHYVLLSDGMPIDSCAEAKSLAPMIHGNMLPLVYDRTPCLTGIHAAAVVKNEQCLLMPAVSGSGKSTLTSALVANGFDYCSDDMVLLTFQPVRIRPAPASIGLKKGSWSILETCHPSLATLPTHLRNDHKRIRYLPPPDNLLIKDPGTQLAVSHIVFPRYQPDRQVEIRTISQAEGLCRITEAGYDVQGGLNAARVEQMVQWISQVPCFEFIYSDLKEAVDALKGLLGES